MKLTTRDQILKTLRRECVPAPLSLKKIIRCFTGKDVLLQNAIGMYWGGLLDDYHLFPNHKYLKF